LLALTLAAATAVGCASEAGVRGALMLVVDTNLVPGRDFDELRLREGAATQELVDFRYGIVEGVPRALNGGALPWTYSVQSEGPTPKERFVTLSAWKANVPVFARKVGFVIPEGTTRELRMTVEALCSGTHLVVDDSGLHEEPWARATGADAASCDGSTTCLAGRCRSVHIDTETLPAFERSNVFGGAPGPSERGRCVDLFGCFAEGRASERIPAVWVVPRRTPVGCVIDMQSGIPNADELTVAYEAEPGTGGSCSESGCIAWLERASSLEAEPGWVQSGNRIVLPEALCDEPVRRVFVARETSAACAGKSRSTPVCASWSSVGTSTSESLETRRLSVDGTRDSETVCAIQTPATSLCVAMNVRCGDILAPDAFCADRLLEARFAHCGTCKGSTEGMQLIPGGVFRMGSTQSAVDRGIGLENELPQHLVRVPPYYMDRTEVTVGAYKTCVDAGVCELPYLYNAQTSPAYNFGAPGRDDHPINGVTWFDANAFCAWRGARLPTEEEYEFAARSGANEFLYPWGNTLTDDDRLCWSGRQRRTLSCPVGAFPSGANAWGILDLVGNMHEWTASGASPSYDKARSTAQRIDRGGGWPTAQPSLVRANRRGPNEPRARSYQTGFRCVRDR
jgi:formylglycine-generating enzyme required for sulfatase activity